MLTVMPTAGTRHLLTSEPGIPSASKQDRHLFRGGSYSSKYGNILLILILAS